MVEQYYKANKEAYKYPAKAKLSMIVTLGGGLLQSAGFVLFDGVLKDLLAEAEAPQKT